MSSEVGGREGRRDGNRRWEEGKQNNGGWINRQKQKSLAIGGTEVGDWVAAGLRPLREFPIRPPIAAATVQVRRRLGKDPMGTDKRLRGKADTTRASSTLRLAWKLHKDAASAGRESPTEAPTEQESSTCAAHPSLELKTVAVNYKHAFGVGGGGFIGLAGKNRAGAVLLWWQGYRGGAACPCSYWSVMPGRLSQRGTKAILSRPALALRAWTYHRVCPPALCNADRMSKFPCS